MATVGVYRWGNILFARAAIASFRSDALCIATLAARVIQSCVHISHEQTNAFAAVRFSFYSVMAVRQGLNV